MTKFTKGPWGIGEFKNTSSKGNPIYKRAIFTERQLKKYKHPLPIAWVCGDPGTKEKVEANAHLIAAAPDLYEALEACLNVGLAGVGDFRDAMDKGKAALKKARVSDFKIKGAM